MVDKEKTGGIKEDEEGGGSVAEKLWDKARKVEVGSGKGGGDQGEVDREARELEEETQKELERIAKENVRGGGSDREEERVLRQQEAAGKMESFLARVTDWSAEEYAQARKELLELLKTYDYPDGKVLMEVVAVVAEQKRREAGLVRLRDREVEISGQEMTVEELERKVGAVTGEGELTEEVEKVEQLLRDAGEGQAADEYHELVVGKYEGERARVMEGLVADEEGGEVEAGEREQEEAGGVGGEVGPKPSKGEVEVEVDEPDLGGEAAASLPPEESGKVKLEGGSLPVRGDSDEGREETVEAAVAGEGGGGKPSGGGEPPKPPGGGEPPLGKLPGEGGEEGPGESGGGEERVESGEGKPVEGEPAAGVKEEKMGELAEEAAANEKEVWEEFREKAAGAAEEVEKLAGRVEELAEGAGRAAEQVKKLTGELRDLAEEIEEGTIESIEELEKRLKSFEKRVRGMTERMVEVQGEVGKLDEALELGKVTEEEYREAVENSAKAVEEFTGYYDGNGEYVPGLFEVFAEVAKAAGEKAQGAWEEGVEERRGRGERVDELYAGNGFWNEREYQAMSEDEQKHYRRGFVYKLDKALGEMERMDRPFSQANWQETSRLMRMVFSVKDEKFREELLERYDRHRRANDWRWLYDRAASSKDCTAAANLIPPDAMMELMREERYVERVGVVERTIMVDGEERRVEVEVRTYEELGEGEKVVDLMVDEYQAIGDVMVQLEEMKRSGGEARDEWIEREREKFGRSGESNWVDYLERKYGREVVGELREKKQIGKKDIKKALEGAHKVAIGRVAEAMGKVARAKRKGQKVGKISEVFGQPQEMEIEVVDLETGKTKKERAWRTQIKEEVFDDERLVAELEGLIERDEEGEGMMDEEKGDVYRAAATVFAYLGMDVSDGWFIYGGGFFDRREQNIDDYVRDAGRGRFPDRDKLMQFFRPTRDSRGWMSARVLGLGSKQFGEMKREFGFETGRQMVAGGTEKWATLDWVRIGRSREEREKFLKLSFEKYGVSDRKYSIFHGDLLGSIDDFRVMAIGGGSQSFMALPTVEKLEKIYETDVKWFAGSSGGEAERLAVMAQLAGGLVEFYMHRDVLQGMPLVERREVKDVNGKVVGYRWAMNESYSEKQLGLPAWGVARIEQVVDRVTPYIGTDHAEWLKREYMRFAGLKGKKLVREFRKFWETLEPHRVAPVVIFTLLLGILGATKEGIMASLAEEGMFTPPKT